MKPEFQKIIDEALKRIKDEEDDIENLIFKVICAIAVVNILIALCMMF